MPEDEKINASLDNPRCLCHELLDLGLRRSFLFQLRTYTPHVVLPPQDTTRGRKCEHLAIEPVSSYHSSLDQDSGPCVDVQNCSSTWMFTSVAHLTSCINGEAQLLLYFMNQPYHRRLQKSRKHQKKLLLTLRYSFSSLLLPNGTSVYLKGSITLFT